MNALDLKFDTDYVVLNASESFEVGSVVRRTQSRFAMHNDDKSVAFYIKGGDEDTHEYLYPDDVREVVGTGCPHKYEGTTSTDDKCMEIAPKLWTAYKDRLNEEALNALRQVILDTEKHNTVSFNDTDSIDCAFSWSSTKQGKEFWRSVYTNECDIPVEYPEEAVANEQHTVMFNGTSCEAPVLEVPWKRGDLQTNSGEPVEQSHYQGTLLQPLEIMQATMTAEQFQGFLMGNIIKYGIRGGNKVGESAEKDRKKVETYTRWLALARSGHVINPMID